MHAFVAVQAFPQPGVADTLDAWIHEGTDLSPPDHSVSGFLRMAPCSPTHLATSGRGGTGVGMGPLGTRWPGSSPSGSHSLLGFGSQIGPSMDAGPQMGSKGSYVIPLGVDVGARAKGGSTVCLAGTAEAGGPFGMDVGGALGARRGSTASLAGTGFQTEVLVPFGMDLGAKARRGSTASAVPLSVGSSNFQRLFEAYSHSDQVRGSGPR